MSKLAIFLFAVLVSSAVNAYDLRPWLKSVEIAMEKLEQFHKYSVDGIKQKFDFSEYRQDSENTFNEIIKFVDNIWNKTKEFMDINSKEIIRLIENVIKNPNKNFDVSNYRKIFHEVIDDGHKVIAEAIKDSLNELDIEFTLYDIGVDRYKNVSNKLMSLMDEARNCNKNVINVKAVRKAILCAKEAKMKEMWFVKISLPKLQFVKMYLDAFDRASSYVTTINKQLVGFEQKWSGIKRNTNYKQLLKRLLKRPVKRPLKRPLN